MDWIRGLGVSHVAVHLDVDVIDSTDIGLGLGMVPDGLSRSAVIELLGAIGQGSDVVGLTIAEYVPRRALALQELLARLPLLGSGEPLGSGEQAPGQG